MRSLFMGASSILALAALVTSCGLIMSDLSKGDEPDTEPDASPDGGVEYCPGYEPGMDIVDECCTPDNPCGWAEDNSCDCAGTCEWDTVDCGGDTDVDADTDSDADADTDSDTDQDGGPDAG